jgi:hypothetical protein
MVNGLHERHLTAASSGRTREMHFFGGQNGPESRIRCQGAPSRRPLDGARVRNTCANRCNRL